MLDAPPREREWVSWAGVAAWTLVVFATIPVARALQEAVRDRFGTEAFAAAVIAAIALAAGLALRSALRRPAARAGAPWLALVAAVFVGYTFVLRANAEEALHFVQYGVLGVLLYRALLHRLRDPGVYVAAACLGACVGIVDEAIQWLTPSRQWDLRDIWINAFSVAWVQVGIALGLRPALVSGRPGPRSVRWMCRTTAAATILLGLSLLNTPARIAAYAGRIPSLAFLLRNESVMLEYGYRIDDPGAGVFTSRLAPEALRRTDAQRGREAGATLARYRTLDDGYARFLRDHTPVTDPFLHEARVHLFRRDRYLRNFRALRGSDEARDHATVAWHEQRILERWFPETLRHSGYALPGSVREALSRSRRPDARYESAVSRGLVTGVGEREIGLALAALLAALLTADRTRGRS